MSDVRVQRIELTVRLPEVDLLQMLLGRYNPDELRRAGIRPEACALRAMTVEPDGRVSFQLAAFAFADVAGMLETQYEQDQELLKETASAQLRATPQKNSDDLDSEDRNKPGGLDVVQDTHDGGCPRAEEIVRRIRKPKASHQTKAGNI